MAPDAGEAPYQLTWSFESGSYDAATGTTVLRYQGTAVTIALPRMRRGVHYVRVSLSASRLQRRSSSTYEVVRVR